MEQFFGILMAILTLGGGGDLLDLTSAASYWRVKGTTPTVEMLRATIANPDKEEDVSADIEKLGSDEFKIRTAAREALAAKGPAIAGQLKQGTQSKDAEIAATCRDLLAKITVGNTQEAAIRRLMAIRTLGEMKDKDSVPALKKLLESKESFVPEYAQRALDLIAGVARQRGPLKIDDDINLLPKETGSVAQSRGLGSFTIDSFFDAVPEAVKVDADQKPDEARAATTDQVTRGLLSLLERTGNMRLDGMTVGLSREIGPNGGFVIVILRGKYDRKVLSEAVVASGTPGEFTATEEDHVMILTERTTRVLFPSDDTAVLIMGALGSLDDAQKSMLTALKTGKGELPQNAEITALLKTVDKTKDMWAVVQLPTIAKSLPIFAGVDTLTLQASHKGDVVHFDVSGTGPDAEKVAASAAELKKQVDAIITEGKEEATKLEGTNSDHRAQSAMIQHVLAMLDTIKINADGTTAKVSGDFDLLRQVGAYLAFTLRMYTEALRAPVEVPRPQRIEPLQNQ